MPQLIETIDHIARKKQRDVLFLAFYDRTLKERLEQVEDEEESETSQQWENHRNEAWKIMPVRQQVIDWLDAKGIPWQPCGPFMPGWIIMGGYQGDIYLDVPYDKNLLMYRELEAYLQYPDDTMRFENATFFCLTLEQAMKNAEQDDPDFFDNL